MRISHHFALSNTTHAVQLPKEKRTQNMGISYGVTITGHGNELNTHSRSPGELLGSVTLKMPV